MSVEENKAVVQRWVGARNSNDLDAALACWSDDRREGIQRAFNAFSAAFPDVHISMGELIGESDKVVGEFTFTGTHLGAWRSVPATGSKVTLHGIDIYTVEEGKITALVRQMPDLDRLLEEQRRP